jgi:RNA 2',3'-cyclic 3'-phosphodiesterase
MRAFLSCTIPQKVSSYLDQLTTRLGNAKLTIPRQFDLTIKFLGEIPDSLLPEIQKTLSQIRFSPIEAHIGPIGVFSERIVRTVWVKVEPSDPLVALHTLVDEALLPLFPKDDRFTPHITLARVRGLKDRKAFLQSLSSIHVEPLSFRIDRLIFVQSSLTLEGAIHNPLFEIPFVGM